MSHERIKELESEFPPDAFEVPGHMTLAGELRDIAKDALDRCDTLSEMLQRGQGQLEMSRRSSAASSLAMIKATSLA